MRYMKLGASDLRVSHICLGCMGFGDPASGQHSWTVGEDVTREIVKRALDAGREHVWLVNAKYLEEEQR